MSNHVASLVRKKKAGIGATAKAVLLLMADLASDDGAGIWASKQTMANELEMSKRAFQGAVQRLIDAGFIIEIGTRKHRNGATIEYQIVLSELQKCADSNPKKADGSAHEDTTYSGYGRKCTGAGNAPVQEMHGRGAGDSPHGVQEMHPTHPVTILEHGGGDAGARDRPSCGLDVDGGDRTFRERILSAIGVDPVSGMTGRGGARIGTQADMLIASAWVDELGLSEDQVVAEVTDLMLRKRDGPPSSFEYFTRAMQRLAGAQRKPKLTPIEFDQAGGRHGRQAGNASLDDLEAGLASGQVKLRAGRGDPFAGR